MTVGPGYVEPRIRSYGVLQYSFTVGVPERKVGLSVRMSLLRSQPIPLGGFLVVLQYAFTVVVPNPKVELSTRMSLLGSQPILLGGFLVVLKHPTTVVVPNSKVELSFRIPLLSSFAQFAQLIRIDGAKG